MERGRAAVITGGLGAQRSQRRFQLSGRGDEALEFREVVQRCQAAVGDGIEAEIGSGGIAGKTGVAELQGAFEGFEGLRSFTQDGAD